MLAEAARYDRARVPAPSRSDNEQAQVHPDYPPRARIEWVIAGARVVLAVGGLFAIWVHPSPGSPNQALSYALLAMYLFHSLATLALVWKPIEFARAWGLAGHVFDLTVFSAVMFLTDGIASPFYIYFVFSVVCGALRWEAMGALLTTAAALVMSAVIGGYDYLTNPAFEANRLIIRSAQLGVIGAVLAYVGSHHPRTLREVLRFASWPHLIPQQETDAVADIIERANEILPAPTIVLVWQQQDEEHVNVAWRGESGLEWSRERPDVYEPLVTASLRQASFMARDAADAAGHIDFWYKGRFRVLSGVPINEALRQRFEMHAVQSSAISGGLVKGRVFWLGRRRMRIDDLVVGDLVARIAASRLESAYLAESLRETAALNERLRVARDLHDSVLQSLAGTALQLEVAGRVVDRDPRAAKRNIADVQALLEQSEHEIRALIRRLRPHAPDVAESANLPLGSRLQAFGRRIEQQWKIPVVLQVAPEVEALASGLRQQLLLIAQEAVLNAARHSDAATIRASLATADHVATAEIVDDGKGFGFTGSYDLASLTALDAGPLTLRERVLELGGQLHIQSGPSGSQVRIALPLPHAATPHHADLTRSRR